jgi:adenylate cyclase
MSNHRHAGLLSCFLPQDRRLALAVDRALPEHCKGAVLLADVGGFTQLAERLCGEAGPRRGAEELGRLLRQLYDALIGIVEGWGGSVIGFSGDAFTAWFASEECDLVSTTTRAARCALALQEAMSSDVRTPAGLTLSVGLCAGAARRLVVGDPAQQCFDVLAGQLLDRVVQAESQAEAGTVVVDQATAQLLAHAGFVTQLITGGVQNDGAATQFFVLCPQPVAAGRQDLPPLPNLDPALLQPWVLPVVARRIALDTALLLDELRPVATLMVRFAGIAFDADEQAGAKLDRFVRWVQQTLAIYDGTLIDLTLGEESNYLYAVCGAPHAHDDDVVRALAAAQALISPPVQLGVGALRIGVSYGQMRAGLIGGASRHCYAVLGDAANLAFRLMNSCPAGAIRCDETVVQQSRERWHFQPLPPLHLKGKAALIMVWQPLGPKQEREPSSQLIGRAPELALLTGMIDQCDGAPHTLLIVGEAGIGKSQLIATMRQMLHQRGYCIYIGRGQSTEAQAPYAAWRSVIAAIVAERSSEMQLSPLLNDIHDLSLPENEFTRGLNARQRSEALNEYVAALLLSISEPLALILEDAHWFDSRSWELLLHLSRRAARHNNPLLLLISLRPLDSAAAGQSALRDLLRLPGVRWQQLSALTLNEVQALAAARLGCAAERVPPTLTQLLHRRAGGNPFLVEQLLMALCDQGVVRIVPDDDAPRCETDNDLSQAAARLPSTIQGLLLARLDRLPPDAQLTARIAAVVGPLFNLRQVRFAYDQLALTNSAGVKPALLTLAAQHITELEQPEPELSYRFCHALMHEATYETLLFAQRRDLHRVIAAWYEAEYPGEQGSRYYPLLAHHYREAEEPARERYYAVLAGVAAADRYANVEALAHFKRALALTDPADLRGRFDILLAREQIYDVLAERQPQAADLAALTELAAAMHDRAIMLKVNLREINFAFWTGDYATVTGRAAAAEAEAELLGDHDALIDLQRWQTWALMRSGAYERAQHHAARCLALAQASANQAGLLLAFDSLAVVATRRGAIDEAIAHQQRCLELSRALGLRRSEAIQIGNLGSHYWQQMRYEQAADYFRQSLTLACEIGDQRGEGWALGSLGQVFLQLGELEQAQWHLSKSLELMRAAGDRRYEGIMLCQLARLAALQALYGALVNNISLSTALNYCEQGLAILQAVNARDKVALAFLIKGQLLLAHGDIVAARLQYEAALTRWHELGHRLRCADALCGLAACALAAADLTTAVGLVDEVLEIIQTTPISAECEIAIIYQTCYKVLRASGDIRADTVHEAWRTWVLSQARQISNEEVRARFLASWQVGIVLARR